MLRAFGVTDKGPVRPGNEDCFGIHEDLGLCVVADGMGGHNAGEVAAQIAVDVLVEHVRWSVRASAVPEGQVLYPFGVDPSLSAAGNLLRNGVLLAGARILETAATADAYTGMGTTVVAAYVSHTRLTVAHVGDSRLYLHSGDGLRLLTTDDTWTATMLARDPDGDPLRYQHHPMRHALTNVVGSRARTDVHVVEAPLAGGEVLLLTTDGVHGVIGDGELARLTPRTADLSAMASEIVQAALAHGARDNCTAVVARYSEKESIRRTCIPPRAP
jgi:serine/threonine protein phosphatase PrpC